MCIKVVEKVPSKAQIFGGIRTHQYYLTIFNLRSCAYQFQ